MREKPVERVGRTEEQSDDVPAIGIHGTYSLPELLPVDGTWSVGRALLPVSTRRDSSEVSFGPAETGRSARPTAGSKRNSPERPLGAV